MHPLQSRSPNKTIQKVPELSYAHLEGNNRAIIGEVT